MSSIKTLKKKNVAKFTELISRSQQLNTELFNTKTFPQKWKGETLERKIDVQSVTAHSYVFCASFMFSVVVQSFSHVHSLRPHRCNMPDFPVLHYLLEFAQTHAHWIDDAIQPSHPLLAPTPPALNLSHILNTSCFKHWIKQ